MNCGAHFGPMALSLISITASERLSINFARFWEIQPQILASLKRFPGEAIGLSLRSRLLARVHPRRVPAKILLFDRTLQPVSASNPENMIRFSFWMRRPRERARRGPLPGRYPALSY